MKLRKRDLFGAILLACAFTFLIACGGGGGSSSEPDPVPEPTPEPIVLEDPEIGVSAFALMNERYPVLELVDILRQGNPAKRPAFAILHRSFGEKYDNYYHVQSELEGLNPHVHIYATCGPCRRGGNVGRSMEHFLQSMDVGAFNWALRDPGVQEQYKAWLRDIKDKYILAYPNSTFTVIPELESNMDYEAYIITYNLAKEVFAGDANVDIVVNPMSASIQEVHSWGIERAEKHTTNIYGTGELRGSVDILNFDGSIFLYADESADGYDHWDTIATWDEIQDLIIYNRSRGIMVYLWKDEWQGLAYRGGNPTLPPDQRTYTFNGRHAEIVYLLNL